MKKLIEKHLKKIIFSHLICGLIMTIVFIGILIKLKNGNDIITKFKLNKLDIIFLAFFVFFHLIIFICVVKYNSFSLSMVFLFIPSIPLNIIFFDIYLIKKFPFHFYKETNKIDINDVLLNYCDKYSTKSNDNKDNKQVNDEDNYKKGMVFEYQIINEYIELGYEVKWNALLMEKDNGIDLIAKNKDTLIFIQCKNHSNEPNQKDIRAFLQIQFERNIL
ncbi:hypothetical protein MADP07_00475 [Mycoplasma anatis]|uniref:Restriction endonuclease type IV Mrr domain-containing protein n=1 Tax=Mycoplasmopsis anatis TaxID=171279 RepID=A0A9Q3QDV2_9BACT|nr:restriction endonuclease [Mycoplasmopsis anatis]MBW0596193.1 hypothetical protein [Mycoplasmopsis anatis]MBW0596871.1 hypothetical protein [Mycoplasmopsis anatis]MBW0597627.1 hypothetical protein [Mycoplasmopsis anatis]MBW0599675.1 hypothetical protein [Mycoplasmopsis anatis]MBW0600570.1 hypothetical protein [Mycoplasmopsis anatis]